MEKRNPLFLYLVLVLTTAGCSDVPSSTQAAPRTGIPYVDTVIEAAESGDRAALESLVHLSTFPCTTREGFGGPPKCLPGESEGTLVQALPVLGTEGGHVREVELDQWERIGAARLVAVYKTNPATYADEFFPAGEFAVVLLPADSQGLLTLQVTPEGIVRFDHAFGPTLHQLFSEHEEDFLLGPFDIIE